MNRITFNQRSLRLLIISAMTFSGLGLRFIEIDHPLWLDELTTAWVVRDDMADMLERCWINNLSPLYYGLVMLSNKVFGYTEIGLRIPSVIAGTVSIPLIYVLSYRLTESYKISILSALFCMADFAMVEYSLEVRPYALVQCGFLIQFLLFLNFFEEKPTPLSAVGLGFISGILFLLHYTVATLFIAEMLIFSVGVVYGKCPFTKRHIFCLALTVSIFLFHAILVSSHLFYLSQNKTVLGSFIKVRAIDSILVLFYHLPRFIIYPLLLSSFAHYCLYGSNVIRGKNPWVLFLLSSMYFTPVFIHWVLASGNVVNLFLARYLAGVVPIVLIGSAMIVSMMNSKFAQFIFIITALGLTQYWPIPVQNQMKKMENSRTQSIFHHEKEFGYGWHEAVRFINRSDLSVEKVYVLSGLVESNMLKENNAYDPNLYEYLLSPVNSIYKLHDDYLEKSVPIHSYKDIDREIERFIVVGGGIDLCGFENYLGVDAVVDKLSDQSYIEVMWVHPSITDQE